MLIHIILSIIKWLFILIAGLIALILILMCFQSKIEISYTNDVLFLSLKYLFLKLKILPGTDKNKSPNKNASKSKKRKTEERKTAEKVSEPVEQGNDSEKHEHKDKENSSKNLSDIFQLIRSFIDPGTWAIRYLLSKILIDDIVIVFDVTGEDPCKIGMKTGEAWAAIGNMTGFLNRVFPGNVTFSELRVNPCFGETRPEGKRFGCTISTRLIIMIVLAFGFLFRWLKERHRIAKENEA